MAKFTISVNGKNRDVDVLPDTPLLWVLRDQLGLLGTKYGCGLGGCGSCTVLLGDRAQRSCQLPMSEVRDQRITTIEGLSENGTHPVQKAWLEEDVPQCGYCQTGQIMAAAALLKGNPNPSDQDIDDLMGGNFCRCGTYDRMRKAIHRAAKEGVK